MKILEVIPSLEIGGAQRLIEYIVPYLQIDNEVEIVVFHKTGSEIEKNIAKSGIPIHSLDVGAHSPRAIKKLRSYLKEADVVHAHLFPTHYYLILANQGINKPIIFTEHNTHNKRRNHKWIKPIEKRVYRNLNSVVGISEKACEELNNWLDLCVKDKITLIENGINLPLYQQTDSTLPKFIFGKEGLPVIMVSRFSKAKDQDTVVKALPHIKDPSVFMVFVGDGERRVVVEKLAEDLGMKDRVLFLGNQNNIPELLKSSYIGVQSSYWEGLPLTALEIMASELPLVASKAEGLYQIAEGAGLLFEIGDAKQLAQYINQLLDNKQLYNEMKQKSKEKASQYSAELTAQRYLKLFHIVNNK